MPSENLNEKILKIKDNDEEINLLLEKYKPFIAACTGEVSGKFVKYGEDDELSVAMMAFVEAIKVYDGKKGNFLPFSSQVIKRRIIDYYRKEKRHKKLFFPSRINDDEEVINATLKKSCELHREKNTAEMRRIEIEQLREELNEWGISFFDLAKSSPKHKKTRQMCKEIAGFLLSHDELINSIWARKQLPVSEIENALQIPRKIIDRFRRYIIAVIIIATGDYQYIRDYVCLEGKGQGDT